MIIISYIAMLCSLGGNYFLNRKKVILGMYIWSIGSIIWIIFSVYNKVWSQVIMFCCYTYFNIEGIIKWSKKG